MPHPAARIRAKETLMNITHPPEQNKRKNKTDLRGSEEKLIIAGNIPAADLASMMPPVDSTPMWCFSGFTDGEELRLTIKSQAKIHANKRKNI